MIYTEDKNYVVTDDGAKALIESGEYSKTPFKDSAKNVCVECSEQVETQLIGKLKPKPAPKPAPIKRKRASRKKKVVDNG